MGLEIAKMLLVLYKTVDRKRFKKNNQFIYLLVKHDELITI